MKKYEQNTLPIVRIQFGSKSLSFIDTNVNEVYSIGIMIFKEVKVNTTLAIKDWCPLNKPLDKISTLMHVREEIGKRKINGSRSKMLYGISADEAIHIFEVNYEDFYKKLKNI